METVIFLFTSVPSNKNYQNIIGQIKAAILGGELENGSRLPTELEMAEQFGVSRSSVREAMKALEVMGVVESRKGGGSYVVNHLGPCFSDVLSLQFMLSNGSLENLLGLRMAIELGAVDAIVKRSSDMEISELGVILQKYLDAPTLEIRQQYDIQFHIKLVSLANNSLFDFILGSMDTMIKKDVAFSHQADAYFDQAGESMRLHQEVYRALVARNPGAACAALRAHYDMSLESLNIQNSFLRGKRSV